ncbi:MAG TPA: SDR family NAD(P)-dependent oxidoreductase [Terriglobales bacterium]|nr:SDR family NAD(P)-dependent oxidoreductase [Terriglobales bacterium]
MSENTADHKQPFKGKMALITGASKGIGFAIAKKLAAEGCDLTITARNRAALEEASRELLAFRVRVLAEACDVSKASEVESLFTSVRQQSKGLDILINNAGISHAMAPVDQLAPEVWERVIATNLTGMFLVTRAAIPLMRAGSTIVNNISVKAVFAGEAAYCASKHGALALTNTLREELRPKKIRVIALIPGATNTEIWNQFWPDAPRANMISPETIADAVVSALLLPANTSMDELVINPVTGTL